MSGIRLQSAPAAGAKQQAPAQAAEGKRKSAKHVVPGTVPSGIRGMILTELRNGRSVPQAAKEYTVVGDVVLEIYIRDLEQRMRGFERRIEALVADLEQQMRSFERRRITRAA